MVPELVFLNCCHLGQMDLGSQGNLLAASISRELIDIGVRCVIVAGWAVNDQYARRFSQVFYEQLLLHRRPFGDAVYAARRAVWQDNHDDITWGAFQAYGEAGWLAEPRADDAGTGDADSYVSLDELLDDLARMRAELSRKRDRQSERDGLAQAKGLRDKLKQRCPASWLALPQLQSALGATWRDLGQLDDAREAFLKAVQAEDRAGRVPIRDIEQLADIEARLGQSLAEKEIEVLAASLHASPDKSGAVMDSAFQQRLFGLIDRALQRLDGLDAVVSEHADVNGGQRADPAPNGARSALRGMVLQRKASLHARLVVLRASGRLDVTQTANSMREVLASAVQAYKLAEGSPTSGLFLPYLALNRLALDALTPWNTPEQKDAAIALAEQCRKVAAQSYALNPSVRDAVMQPEALLVQRLLDGSFGRGDASGQAAFDEVARAYAESISGIPVNPAEIDSVLCRLELLSLFHDALSQTTDANVPGRLVADRILELVQSLRPSRARARSRAAPALAPAPAPEETRAEAVQPARPAAKTARKPRKPPKAK